MRCLALALLACLVVGVAPATAQQSSGYPSNLSMFNPGRVELGVLGGYLFNYEADGSKADTPTFPKEAVIALEAIYHMTPQLEFVLLPSYGADTKLSRTQAFVRMNLWKGEH